MIEHSYDEQKTALAVDIISRCNKAVATLGKRSIKLSVACRTARADSYLIIEGNCTAKLIEAKCSAAFVGQIHLIRQHGSDDLPIFSVATDHEIVKVEIQLTAECVKIVLRSADVKDSYDIPEAFERTADRRAFRSDVATVQYQHLLHILLL